MKRTTCPFDCWDACGALVDVGPGNAVTLRGDPGHPFSRGTICGKLASYPAFLRSGHRLTRPLLREGTRWREVSWDDALDLCVRELEEAMRAGPDAILFDLGNANCGVLRFAGQRFFRLLGATVTTGSLCDIAGEKGLQRTAGACLSHPPSDVLNSRAVILWGRNPAATNIHFWRFVQDARRRGAQVAAVDVYASATARRADLFLCIRPGTDVYLVLGVARALRDLDLFDRDFLAAHTSGTEDFMPIVDSLTVAEAARACDVDPDQIYQLARLYAVRPASTWLGMGMQHYRWGMTAASFVAALGALAGQFGVPGGGVSFFTASLTPFNLDWANPPPLPGVQPGSRLVRKPALAADLLAGPPYHVAWFQASNIAKQAPDSAATARALAKVGFKVAVELRMSETASLCDLVLPAASFLEYENVRGSYGTPWVGHMPAVVPPPADCRSEPDIYAELARRLGCESEYLADGGPEEWIHRALAPLQRHGISLESLRQEGGTAVTGDNAYPALPFAGGIFPTLDGRFHFPTREDFQRYLTLQSQWEEEQEPARYPLHLITPKSPSRINSHAATAQGDAASSARPTGTPHGPGTPEEAAGNGGLPVATTHPSHLPQGQDTALLVTPLGRIRVRLVADPEMKPGIVVIEQGGQVPGTIGINALTPATVSEDGEGACYYEARCRLEP